MEVVLHSQGKAEKMTIGGHEVVFEPGKPTVVPDEVGERLLSKRQYITPKAYKTWKQARDKKEKKATPKKGKPDKKEESK